MSMHQNKWTWEAVPPCTCLSLTKNHPNLNMVMLNGTPHVASPASRLRFPTHLHTLMLASANTQVYPRWEVFLANTSKKVSHWCMHHHIHDVSLDEWKSGLSAQWREHLNFKPRFLQLDAERYQISSSTYTGLRGAWPWSCPWRNSCVLPTVLPSCLVQNVWGQRNLFFAPLASCTSSPVSAATGPPYMAETILLGNPFVRAHSFLLRSFETQEGLPCSAPNHFLPWFLVCSLVQSFGNSSA